jgi:hypothetical protein
MTINYLLRYLGYCIFYKIMMTTVHLTSGTCWISVCAASWCRNCITKFFSLIAYGCWVKRSNVLIKFEYYTPKKVQTWNFYSNRFHFKLSHLRISQNLKKNTLNFFFWYPVRSKEKPYDTWKRNFNKNEKVYLSI